MIFRLCCWRNSSGSELISAAQSLFLGLASMCYACVCPRMCILCHCQYARLPLLHFRSNHHGFQRILRLATSLHRHLHYKSSTVVRGISDLVKSGLNWVMLRAHRYPLPLAACSPISSASCAVIAGHNSHRCIFLIMGPGEYWNLSSRTLKMGDR